MHRIHVRQDQVTHMHRLSEYPLPETQPVPRAKPKAHGTGTLCREHQIELSAQKKPVVQTVCAEREQSRLSAQPRTHSTEALWRELQKKALGIAETSQHNETAVTAIGPTVKCAESPPFGSRCRVLFQSSRQRIKKNQIHTSKPFASSTYTPTKHMLKFHIKIHIYFVFNNFISF
jgi:hypothetical protein